MIATDRTSTATSLPLRGLHVGISGAVPERKYWGGVADLDRLILSFVSQLSALVMAYGGTIVHGSNPSFTPTLAEQARERTRQHSGSPQPAPLTLIASKLWGDPPRAAARAARVAQANLILTPRFGHGDAKDERARNDSLTALRLALVQRVDVLIAVGGKLHRSTGFNPGVLEELTLARWRNVQCFVVAGLGGITGQLDADMIREFSAGNAMAESDIKDMAVWTDSVDEYVGKLLTHLAQHRKLLLAQKREWTFRGAGMPGALYRSSPTGVAEVADIDAELVRRTAHRFAAVQDAVGRSDIGSVRALLATPPT